MISNYKNSMHLRSFLCKEAKIKQRTSPKTGLCVIGEKAIWESRFFTWLSWVLRHTKHVFSSNGKIFLMIIILLLLYIFRIWWESKIHHEVITKLIIQTHLLMNLSVSHVLRGQLYIDLRPVLLIYTVFSAMSNFFSLTVQLCPVNIYIV